MIAASTAAKSSTPVEIRKLNTPGKRAAGGRHGGAVPLHDPTGPVLEAATGQLSGQAVAAARRPDADDSRRQQTERRVSEYVYTPSNSTFTQPVARSESHAISAL